MTDIVLITGGASGIGKALATAYAERGAFVAIADRQIDAAREVAASIGGAAFELDVRDLAGWQKVVGSIVRERGRIDALFNNAGIGVGGAMEEYEQEDWDDVFDVNLRGVAYGVQAVYPIMKAQRAGRIVNTASMAGLVGAPGAGSYTATKHAVVGLSKALRIEAKRHGVRVNVLCPGVIRTPILGGGKFGRSRIGVDVEKMLAQWERMRPMDPDRFARQVLAALDRDEAIIVVPRWWKALWYLERISPAASMALWSRFYTTATEELAIGASKPPREASTDPVPMPRG
jgi:NAD(P)-dependent dehydrogenase (short-subunit alcohol dehydrogenase family)